MKKRKFTVKTNILLAFVMLFAVLFSGCGKPAKKPKDPQPELPVLKIGSDEYSPYFYMSDDGSFTGIDVELATEACRRIGYKAEFHPISWLEKDTYLKNGEVDCLWGSFSMTGREDKYTWAGPYMNSRQVVAVLSESDITKLSDLEGKRIGVQTSSKPDELFSSGGDNVPKVKYIYGFSSMSNVLAALKKNYVDAIAGHETAIAEYIKASPESYRILDETLLSVNLGVAFYKESNNTALVEKLTIILDEMKADGFTAQVLAKYGLDPERTQTK